MKSKILALLIPALLSAGAAHAAEIYNKDGNKLDLYGKVDGLHYFPIIPIAMVIRVMYVLVLKAKHKLLIN